MISTSYGHVTGGFIVGGGYGKDEDLAIHADRIAELLVNRFGKPAQKRGNSDGLSAGAFHDKPAKPGMFWGDTVFGVSANRRHGAIQFDAILHEPLDLHRRGFTSAEEAVNWLSWAMTAKGRRGFRICEKCGGDTESVLDGEAWCEPCERYQ